MNESSLKPEATISHYRVTGKLGSGGMGDVYRARDTKLNREVAIKVLPEGFAQDAERVARFQREAQVLASINHPNIAAIYGLEESNGAHALVLELVEGPTLADRIAAGPIPIAEALPIARQIAEALEYAHEKGIIHRDLKPANIKVTPDGAVKVLDFGLAKIFTEETSATDQSHSPTMIKGTQAGMILGTAAYMSPEQAQGKPADRRSDIWSFGVVLHEMLSGTQIFSGETLSDTLAAVLRADLDWNALPADTPNHIRGLLKRCITRDRRQRLQAIGEARLSIEHPDDANNSLSTHADPIARRPRRSERLAWALVAVAVVVAAGLGLRLLMKGSPVAPTIHATIPAPSGGIVVSNTSTPIPLAIAPDGSRLAYCARVGEGPVRLWVRSIGSDDAHPLAAATENAQSPFFSPDGRSIGFFADGKLKRVDLDGGPVVTLANAVDSRGGSWSARGVILFSASASVALSLVSADGGAVTPATSLDTTVGEATHRYPWFLPDGVHFLYLARRSGAGAGVEPTVYAGSLDSHERTRVLNVASNVVYSSGCLLFVRQGVLVAQEFDLDRLATVGSAMPLSDKVRMDERFSRGDFAVSQNGVLAYLTGKSQTRTQLRWLDRSGATLGSIGEYADYTYGGVPRISPDGRRTVMPILNPEKGNSSLWIIDLDSGRRRRLTLDDGDHAVATWSHDGLRVFFNSNSGGVGGSIDIVSRAADGSGTADTLYRGRPESEISNAPRDCSPDGRWILFSSEQAGGAWDIYALPAVGKGDPLLIATGSNQAEPQFSPDGRFVAYDSAVSGRNEIYVAAFPPNGAKWQVSQEGGTEPRWSRDGKEFFYFDRENRLTAVEVKSSAGAFEAGASRILFQLHAAGWYSRYDVVPDGKRFLVTAELDDQEPSLITLVANWQATLKR